MDRMLQGGAGWAVQQGYGRTEDLDRIEEAGRMPGAQPDAVSPRARKRQREEMGTSAPAITMSKCRRSRRF
jgi:tRNA-splicing ligase RtcB (3'-phosphate/5'-hydroxy nucleic acid ligase)